MIHVSQLFAVNTAAKILATGLEVAKALSVPVDTWRTGDPTQSLYHYLAEVLSAHDSVVAEFVRAGFLSSAVASAKESGNSDWLVVLAYDQYGVTVPSASYATPTVTLRNVGGGYYPRLAGEITVRCSATGKTFRNTDAPAPLNPGAVVTFALVADEPGSASTVAAGEIDEVVTTMLGVEVVSSTAGYGADAPTPDEIEILCRNTLGSISVNGPPDAYEAVCLNPERTGTSEPKRAYSSGDSTTGLARVFLAGAAGGVSAATLALCQTAVEVWSTPLCITPQVLSATPVQVPLIATVQGSGIPTGFEALITAEYVKYLAGLPIEGTVARSAVLAAIHRAVPQITSVSLASPTVDTVMGVGQVATAGAVAVVEF